jgi:energy-coupling factor transporter ATP-binding protein EcfA2
MKAINVEFGQHWAIIGGTGSGKTTLCKAVLGQLAQTSRGQIPIYILDSKISGDFIPFYRKGYGVLHEGNTIPPIHEPLKYGAFQVWQPLEDDKELYNEYFKQIYTQRQPCVIYIDELSSITGIQGTPPRYYEICLKQLRQFGGTVISTTQSSTYVPPSLLRQCTHLVKMNVNGKTDNKKLSELLGTTEQPLHDHGFFYRNVMKPIRSNPVLYYKNMQEFFKIK